MGAHITKTIRRLVMSAALLAGAAAWVMSALAPADLAYAAAPTTQSAGKEAKQRSDAASSAEESGADKDASTKNDRRDNVTITPRGIVIDDGDKHVRIAGGDREYDSFEQFAKDAPWLAGLVFFVVALVFLVPLLIIVLLIWYKVRKNRMLNETMIKLAEKGVVPPAEALSALNADRVGATVTTSPATAPMYEQAKALRRRAASSDLRRGVLLIAVGFGLVAYSMFDDGTPNGLGLVLLFVGIGFCVLWFFEERDPAQRSGSPPPGSLPPGGA
jgi:Domain of unknown function (DUF6249)